MASRVTTSALRTVGGRSDAESHDLDDRALIDAVRGGNVRAFGTLYERHVGAVWAFARRLCRNPADADDVVADVFTNTLRAIKAGRGPREEMRSYVMTATRHTVIKLRTRRDTGHATPTPDFQLDNAMVDAPYEGAGAIGDAFVQLSSRFRTVLWLSCVEGLAPAEVGRHTSLSAGAVSSLTLRARRALARSYLVSRISQPVVSAECAPVRELLPSIIREEVAAGTISRVDRHLATCRECREAFDEMQSLAASLRSIPWLAAAVAWLRSLAGKSAAPQASGALGAAGFAPALVSGMAMIAFTVGHAVVPVHDAPPPPSTVSTPEVGSRRFPAQTPIPQPRSPAPASTSVATKRQAAVPREAQTTITVGASDVPSGPRPASPKTGQLPADDVGVTVTTLAEATASELPPVITTPIITTPIISTPIISTPIITTPVITTPIITTPVVTTPVITTPVVTTPVVTTPGVTVPETTTSVPALPVPPLP